jgi:putative NADH-flavin reductase
VLALALAGIAACAAGVPAAFAQQKAAQPLKIVVYGGSGNIGSRIVAEAAARGHEVTVVDRDPKADRAPRGVKLVRGDALDAKDVSRNIAGQDAVVSAVIVRPPPMPDFSLKVAQTAVEAQRTQQAARKVRLLVVGGASSLYNADGKRIVDTLPPSMAVPEIRSAVAALDFLRTVGDVPWTYFSPPANISPGKRTGKFRLGQDQLVVDANGRSAISMEDYAVAMLDEIESPKHVNARFTAAY